MHKHKPLLQVCLTLESVYHNNVEQHRDTLVIILFIYCDSSNLQNKLYKYVNILKISLDIMRTEFHTVFVYQLKFQHKHYQVLDFYSVC